jgi:hypothetical protein
VVAASPQFAGSSALRAMMITAPLLGHGAVRLGKYLPVVDIADVQTVAIRPQPAPGSLVTD